jgi:predicted amidohydrolase
VDLVIVPSASPGRGVESERLGSQRSWYGLLSTQAEMSGCWIAYCNRVGFEDDINFWGGSAIFAPSGEMRASAPLMDPYLLIEDIDKRAITTARISTPLIADENTELTIRELQYALQERE